MGSGEADRGRRAGEEGLDGAEAGGELRGDEEAPLLVAGELGLACGEAPGEPGGGIVEDAGPAVEGVEEGGEGLEASEPALEEALDRPGAGGLELVEGGEEGGALQVEGREVRGGRAEGELEPEGGPAIREAPVPEQEGVERAAGFGGGNGGPGG